MDVGKEWNPLLSSILAFRGLKFTSNLLWQDESEIPSTVETRKEVLRIRVGSDHGCNEITSVAVVSDDTRASSEKKKL